MLHPSPGYFLGLICKWEDVGADIRRGLKQHSELRNISEKIVIITGDIATLDSIISDDQDDHLEEEDDDEVADIMHQLFEVKKGLLNASHPTAPPHNKAAPVSPLTRPDHLKVTVEAVVVLSRCHLVRYDDGW